MTIHHNPDTGTPTSRILTEPPLLTISGTATFAVPDASERIAALTEPDRFGEVARLLELGAQTAHTISTSTTLRLVEAQVASMTEELTVKLSGLLVNDRGEAMKLLRTFLEEHQAKYTMSVARYLDPESQVSLPSTFKAITETFFKKVEVLLSEGDDSALGRLAERFAKDLDKAVATVIEHTAARHALATRSSLAGRPFEDVLEERLHHLVRPLGATVTRTADTLGNLRKRSGDLLVSFDPETMGGHQLHIVVEAKKRGEGAQTFTAAAMRDDLAVAKENRGAQAGIFAVDCAAFLPLGLGFQELSSSDLAVAFDPEVSDDLGLAVGIRLLHIHLAASITTDGPAVDTEAMQRVVKDIRLAVTTLDSVRSQHRAAINSITKADGSVTDVADRIVALLRRLDELTGM
jgi:hypothetical protein